MMRYYLMSLVGTLVTVYTVFLAVYALMSWFPGAYYSRLGYWVSRVVAPILRPLRRLNLSFLGLDFTILAAIFLLRLIEKVLVVLIWSL